MLKGNLVKVVLKFMTSNKNTALFGRINNFCINVTSILVIIQDKHSNELADFLQFLKVDLILFFKDGIKYTINSFELLYV